jgi:hypothetical protein
MCGLLRLVGRMCYPVFFVREKKKGNVTYNVFLCYMQSIVVQQGPGGAPSDCGCIYIYIYIYTYRYTRPLNSAAGCADLPLTLVNPNPHTPNPKP